MDILDDLNKVGKFLYDKGEATFLMYVTNIDQEITKLRAQVKERTDFEIALKDENERLRKELEALHPYTSEVELSVKYCQLILAVESKHHGETRHQTALRYIKERENLEEVSGRAACSSKAIDKARESE